MNHSISRSAAGLVAGAFVAVLGLAPLAHSQTTPPAGSPQGAPQAPMPAHPPMGPGRGPGMHGGHMMMEIERLKTSLKLTPSQAALWDRARDQMKPATDMREQMKSRHDRMAAMLDDPNFDPRKLAAEMDGVAAQRRTTMTAMRDAWFAVYDSLDPAQRGQVREFLRSRMSHHHRGMGERMGWMHGHDGEPGRAPALSR